MVKSYNTQLLSEGFTFLEGPRWRNSRLFVSDMRAGAVMCLDQDGSAVRVAEVPGWPSGLGFLPDGSMVVVSMNERCVYRVEAEGMSLHADLRNFVTGPLNDMLVTREGRCYVGDIGFDYFRNEPISPGGITLIDTDGTVRRVASGLAGPNGMVMRDGGRTLVVAESFSERIVEFACDETGDLGDPRVLIELPGEGPDGMCMDAAGAIWQACFHSRRFVHINPTGEIIGAIEVKSGNAVACQLGGLDGRTLFCIIYTGTYGQMIQGFPGARVEMAQVDVPGAGFPS